MKRAADKAGEHPLQSLKRVAEALRDGAAHYRAAHGGHPFVLVVDNVDRLAAKQHRVRHACILAAMEIIARRTITGPMCPASAEQPTEWMRHFRRVQRVPMSLALTLYTVSSMLGQPNAVPDQHALLLPSA